MTSKLKWFLSLLVVLASINSHVIAQSIIRQSISSLGVSQTNNGIYISQTVGQPYFTGNYYGIKLRVSPGFQQPLSINAYITPSSGKMEGVSVFPIPTLDKTTVSFSETLDHATVKVFDLNGKLILDDVLIQSRKYEFNCDNWLAGVYFVSIVNTDTHQRHTSKIIISK